MAHVALRGHDRFAMMLPLRLFECLRMSVLRPGVPVLPLIGHPPIPRQVYHATVVQGSILYVPAAFFFCERTMNKDNYGFRVGLVAADAKASGRLMPILEHRKASGASCTASEALVQETSAQCST